VGKTVLHYELTAHGKLSVHQTSQAHQLFVDFDLEFRCWLTSSASPKVVAKSLRSPAQDAEGIVNTSNVDDHDRTRIPLMSLNQTLKQEKAMRGFPAENHQPAPHESSLRHDNVCKPPCMPTGAEDHGAAPSSVSSDVPPNAENEGASNTQARRAAYVNRTHRLSNLSEIAMGELLSTDKELISIETRVVEMRGQVPRVHGTDLALLKSELAQLETRAKQLETKGVDDVYTGELQSGKQLAKETKRDMLRRFEDLYLAMEDLFAIVKAQQK
jgi:hypothetical protein